MISAGFSPLKGEFDIISVKADEKSNEKYKDKITSEFGGYNFCYKERSKFEEYYDSISIGASALLSAGCGLVGMYLGGPLGAEAGYCASSLVATYVSEKVREELKEDRWPHGIGRKRFEVKGKDGWHLF